MMTSKYLTKMGVPHYIVVEPQQVADYQQAIRDLGLLTTVLCLNMSFKNTYDYCDTYGLTKSSGSGPVRNFIWEHSLSAGADYHWIMDDNIKSFRIFNKNEKVFCFSPAFWVAMEDFCLRYTNLAMAGPNYFMFISAREKVLPLYLNTRIYSCNFIRNDLPFRWRGRYNEDTILSLDLLKAGYCTLLFNGFLQEKTPTQTMKGGNTEELYLSSGIAGKYSQYGTIDKSQMLCDLHPDCAKLVYKFNRIHHEVDYKRFKNNKLQPIPGCDKLSGHNNYNMIFRDVSA